MVDPKTIANRTIKNSSLNYDKLFQISKHSMTDTSQLSALLQILMNRFSYCDRDSVKSLLDRRDRIVTSFRKVFDRELQTKKYLMVGSGCPSIFDNGFTLMRNYGVPYIPASAFKGGFSHYVAQELDENNPLRKHFRFLFGTGEGDDNIKGALVFMDVIPKTYSLGIDIVNNHFQPYYSDEKNEKPPNDYYDPVPVQYLVIASGSIFRFSVLEKERMEDSLRKEVSKELINFLGDFGLGAKTSYGYGLFKPVKKD